MTRELLTKLVKSNKELRNVAVVGNVDFGHTVPMVTMPIGGKIKLEVNAGDDVTIKIIEH